MAARTGAQADLRRRRISVSSWYAWRERTRCEDIRACGAHSGTSNTDTKLLINGLFQKGGVLAQDGISLKEIIRTVVNFEGAHSIEVGRLAVVEGEASRTATNPSPHILNALTVCGIRYAHLIVIECALYLYEKLLDESSIERPSGDIYKVTPGVACSPEQAESPRPDWVKFLGGMMISFSNVPNVVRHEIKAVN